MIILTVNGIWSHGKDSVDRLAEPLAAMGHTVIDVVQPIRSPWDVRSARLREHDAMDVVQLAEGHQADAVVGHSYGCLKAALAMKHYNFKAAYLFRPAMSRKWRRFTESTRTTCIYSKQDWAVFFGGLMLHHHFGFAGRSGFHDPNVINMKSTGSHSADFTKSMAQLWAHYINRDLERFNKR